MLNKYPHFNPAKYGLRAKIATVRTGFHCKYNINYHLIWIPKYRRPLLVGKVADVLRTILTEQCRDQGLEPLALEIMPDHIHFFVAAKPTHQAAQLVHQFKGYSSHELRQVFPHLKTLGYAGRTRPFPSLWARGYYCGVAGHVTQEAVRQYVLEQQHKPIFRQAPYESHGQTTIGDFTQRGA